MQAHYTAFYLKENRNIYNNKVKKEEEVDKKEEREEHQRKCICGVSNETSHLVAAKQNTSFFSSCIPPSVSSSLSALFPTFHPHLTAHCFSILYF